MQTISNLTVFTGTIPNKATQTDTDFANNIFGFLNYSGVPFVTDVNTIVNQLNILSNQINIAATQTATNAQNAATATATLVAGSVDDVVISGTKAYSNQKVNTLFSTYENKKGANIASASAITIGTAGLGDTIHITGTTTITSLGAASAIGTRRTLIFDSALTLTHNGTFLICPNNENITTTAGTVVEVVADNLTVWKVLCVSHPSLSFAKMGYLSTITSDLQAQLNGKAATNQTMYIGTTAIPINRTTAAQTLTGTSIDGNAATATALSGTVGSAPSYACRGWVNFNGTGTIAIRASGNVSSITDNGVGDYTVNFTTAIPDANYSTAVAGLQNNSSSNISIGLHPSVAKTTSSVRFIQASATYTLVDSTDISVSIFR